MLSEYPIIYPAEYLIMQYLQFEKISFITSKITVDLPDFKFRFIL